MAGLFPAGGERVPRLRFPEFEGAGEWEEKKLGEVATFLNGRAYSKDELLAQGKYKVLRVGNFFSNNHWYYSDLELEEAKYCDSGDLLYAWSASFGPRIWKEARAIYHYHIWKVVAKQQNEPIFLFHLLDKITDEMKASLKNGLGIFHITKSGIENWVVPFPPTLSEQTRIAAALSSLDDLIAAQGEHIAALQAFKRGLMQGLFPASSADLHATQEAAE
ncbi:restriction endonuclease subunit S [Deinococcus sp. MIMF12]|uniref:Restriction endonuclease subunit S n=1 Tax=Deinococcus rhizophilus TaxID=3049544 RepID=A0ABT7JKV7_9DEIO|nr:restriction endonuclease subunit S [Deinococcus rhizophilus]MDL2345700.1 restriction endonuclease subunit S [Deinococcus rhizophilus]